MKIIRYIKYYRYYLLHFSYRLNGQANMDMHSNGEINILRQVLGKKSNVLDVGTNMGEWLDEAYQIANDKDSSFVAIDANPDALSHVEKKYQKNTRVKIVQAAVSDEQGVAKFYTLDQPDRPSGANSLFFHYYLEGEGAKQFEVPVTTIDKLVEMQKWDIVDFVKLDIEGSEVDALRGARESLKNKKIRYLQIEYNQTWLKSHTSLEDVWNICQEADYRLFRIFPNKLYEICEYHYTQDNFVYSNMLMVPSGIDLDIAVVKDWRPF